MPTKKEQQELEAQLKMMLPPKAFNIFEEMRWVKDEIKKAADNPDSGIKKDKIFSCFVLCTPTDPIRGYEKLIRSHTKEIIERIIDGKCTQDATWAEISGLFSEIVQTPMIKRSVISAYAFVYEKCFGKLPRMCESMKNTDDVNEIQDHIRYVRRKLNNLNRVIDRV